MMALGTAGCDEPCRVLADQVCECEPSEARQNACKSNVSDRAADTKVSEAEQERCSELLDTCTCERLEEGDWAACGLAR